MERYVPQESAEAEALRLRAATGDMAAWGTLLTSHEPRLLRMLAFRLDPRLRGRVDAADVLQEVYVAASEHRADYFRLPPPTVSVFIWLRGVLANKLLEIQRYHLGTRMRDAGREVAGRKPGLCDATSVAILDQLAGPGTGPATAAGRSDVRARLRSALDRMDPDDREVLALRHFEQLTNTEAAAVLGIQERAAAKRYLRALQRLKDVLIAMPGGLTEVRP